MTSTVAIRDKPHQDNKIDFKDEDGLPIYYLKIYENKRIITVAYTMRPDCGYQNIKFAATIFRKDYENEVFHRRGHNNTARDRLKKRPLYTTFFIPDSIKHQQIRDTTLKDQRHVFSGLEMDRYYMERDRFMQEFRQFIRLQFHGNGVCAQTRIKNTHTPRVDDQLYADIKTLKITH